MTSATMTSSSLMRLEGGASTARLIHRMLHDALIRRTEKRQQAAEIQDEEPRHQRASANRPERDRRGFAGLQPHHPLAHSRLEDQRVESGNAQEQHLEPPGLAVDV